MDGLKQQQPPEKACADCPATSSSDSSTEQQQPHESRHPVAHQPLSAKTPPSGGKNEEQQDRLHKEEGRNTALEAALRASLDSKDLGRLCKKLGDEYCLPRRAPRVAGSSDDSGSDTTAPADHYHSSSSDCGLGSEIGPESAQNKAGGLGASAAGDNATHGGKLVAPAVGRNIGKLADAVGIPEDLLASSWNALFAWREGLAEGDLLDVFNALEGEWYLGKILYVEDSDTSAVHTADEKPVENLEAGEGDGAGAGAGVREGQAGKKGDFVRIHYQGWPSKYDETFPRDSSSLQPVHTCTKRPKKPERKKKRIVEAMEWVRTDDMGNIVARGIVGEDDPYEDPEEAEKKAAAALLAEGVATNRYGRKLVTRVDLTTPTSKRKGTGKAGEGEADGNGAGDDGAKGQSAEGEGDGGGSASGGDCAESGGSKGKKTKNRASCGKDGGGSTHDDWICSTCNQLDTPCKSDMVTCDGPCLRSFHVVCLDEDNEALSGEKWICEDCERGEHPCWQCGDYGQDNVMGGVFRCMSNNCGRFYHSHCVELNSNSQVKLALDEGDDGHPVLKFRCGYHTCDTCSAKSGGNKNHLYRCIKCPVAFHLNCIPPDARYHELALLCGDHPEEELPALNADDSILDPLEAEPNDDYPSLGSSCLSSIKTPRNPPKADNASDLRHFRLPMSILTSYHSKPPPFQHICTLHWVATKPVRVEPNEVCTCTDGCGENCLNYMLRTECVCGNGIKAKYQNCRQGPNCGNRRLQNRGVAKVAPFRESGMGWGLMVAEDVPKNTLVGEYLGEVIDEQMMEHRMSEQRRLRPNDGEFYIMELINSLFIDAKEKGNLMRLINHSCDPNCEVQAWNVAGHTRLGIYTKKDLPKGTSLSYDYKFSTNETAKFRCMCGAANCRGTLAPKSKEEEITEDGSKLKGKARREMLQKRERLAKNRQARNQLGQLVTSKRLSLTGRVLPGDKTAEVKAGPPAKYFAFARDQRIFLVRNARAGADLLTRKRLLVCRAESQAKKVALTLLATVAPTQGSSCAAVTETPRVEGVSAPSAMDVDGEEPETRTAAAPAAATPSETASIPVVTAASPVGSRSAPVLPAPGGDGDAARATSDAESTQAADGTVARGGLSRGARGVVSRDEREGANGKKTGVATRRRSGVGSTSRSSSQKERGPR